MSCCSLFWSVPEMLVSKNEMKPVERAETESPKAAIGRASKIIKLLAIMITLGAASITVVSRGNANSMLWSTNVFAPVLGTLLLAVVVVLIANYLSAGGKSKSSHEAIGYDYNARLDL